MDNYFDFFGLEITFGIDKATLKKQYFANTKAYHPDRYINASPQEQLAVLQKSTLNNTAYKTLKDDQKRLAYILTYFGKLGEGTSPQIPQQFLMEMMDINEEVMELRMDYDRDKYNQIKEEAEKIIAALQDNAKEILDSDEPISAEDPRLDQALAYYLKSKYIRRLQENLDKIES